MRAIKRLGLPAYAPHDLRHKWPTLTLTSGVSIHEVSRWLGHRSIEARWTITATSHRTAMSAARQVVEVVEVAVWGSTCSQQA
ncbi:hypothetical protein OG384_04050 [Streptomyces sp. NBC_01324]|nr:hypothetical protein OG384_04050 [Streptomyces sp. NBC_01324]